MIDELHVTATEARTSHWICFSSKNMPPGPFLTSAGWTLDGLISKGRRFLEIPRVSVSDKNLEVIIRAHESSGVPLVIEGMHEHRAWPAAIFNTEWLCENVHQRELGKVVRRFGRGDLFLSRNSGQKRT